MYDFYINLIRSLCLTVISTLLTIISSVLCWSTNTLVAWSEDLIADCQISLVPWGMCCASKSRIISRSLQMSVLLMPILRFLINKHFVRIDLVFLKSQDQSIYSSLSLTLTNFYFLLKTLPEVLTILNLIRYSSNSKLLKAINSLMSMIFWGDLSGLFCYQRYSKVKGFYFVVSKLLDFSMLGSRFCSCWTYHGLLLSTQLR